MPQYDQPHVHERLYAKFQEQFENPDFYIGELMALASKAIRELPDEYRKAFEMNRFEEMTYNEIAERTGVSPKTIAYRISQALKILRTKLKDYIPLLVWLRKHPTAMSVFLMSQKTYFTNGAFNK